MAVNISKTSGVVQIRTAGDTPRIFFSCRGLASPNAAGDGVDIMVNGIPYSVKLTDLQVNGQTPTTIQTAMTLLASIFGT